MRQVRLSERAICRIGGPWKAGPQGLKQAAAVIYDELVDDSILDLAPPGALLEYAGKHGGDRRFGARSPSTDWPSLRERLRW